MTALWLLSTMFVAAAMHVLFATAGWNVPWLLLLGFYLSISLGPRLVLPVFVVFAACVDATFAHHLPLLTLLVLPVIALAWSWRQQGDCRQPLSQFLPASLLGIAHGLGQCLLLAVLAQAQFWQLPVLWQLLLLLVQSIVFSAVLLPVLCLVLDAVAAALSLPRYADAQQRRNLTNGI